MRRSKPPALATWLLEHARSSSTDSVIAGDLQEEFHRGRSAAWYWRQVVLAIAAGWASEVRHHRVLAARAILITWAANCGALLLGHEGAVELFRHRLVAYHPQLAHWAICFLGGVANGLIVAFLDRRHQNAMLLTGAAALLVWALTAILFLKTGSLQHSALQIAGATVTYYLVALGGFAIGGVVARAPGNRKPC